MINANDFIEKFENIYRVKYNGEPLYNVLMEDYSMMVVNNLICETLHPEHTTALLYKFLQMCNVEQKQELIEKFNNNIKKYLRH